MSDLRPAFCDQILHHFGDRVDDGGAGIDMHNIEVAPEHLKELCGFLKESPELSFDFLSDLCGVDFLPDSPRFAVVYHLYSVAHQHRLRLKCRLGDPPHVPSITDIWTTANWHEREAFDMYGIVFDGHPNLKRIYMWDEFEGYPMRKDYPVRGYKDAYNPFGEERGDQ
ncbi:NADH-quinone oxidoreductase subunit C [Pelagibius sp. Alg239-R121]|uniref:NADH-quinone oxidoreductase subunit C n=1 Tax=Pelagibius sp. Alg239-R121 TaxID=2993448 RepID=UPI002AC34AEB|nr:NADH-quinone oxidoreductase subunit C [Pelagibius sp. Alg239-R121]